MMVDAVVACRRLRFIRDAALSGSQFVIATHSPLLMRAADARIFQLDDDGIAPATYDELEVVALWRRFLDAPERILDVLFSVD